MVPCLIGVCTGLATAATVPPITLAWNPNPEPDIAGYELRYGTTSGSYQTTLGAGLNTSTVVSGLTAGVTYYFAVVAYNKAGLRSLPSNEISYTASVAGLNHPPDSTISAPPADVSITAGETVTFAGAGSDPDGNTPLSYEWDFGSGSGLANVTSRNPGPLRFDNPGTYLVTLIVTDSKGFADPSPALRTIVVKKRTTTTGLPDGWIEEPAGDLTILAGDSVAFYGGGIDGKGSEGVRFSWNFGTASAIADSNVRKPVRRRFDQPGTYVVTLTVSDANGDADPSPAKRTITVLSRVKLVPRTGWSLLYVDSEDPAGYEAARAIDGNANTFWHTEWRTKSPPPPHEVQIDLGSVHLLNGFRYLPRQDGVIVGNVDKYLFYTSMDGVNWGRHVASGRFPSSAVEKQVLFPSRRARFVRFVSLGGPDGTPQCNVAELNLLEAP